MKAVINALMRQKIMLVRDDLKEIQWVEILFLVKISYVKSSLNLIHNSENCINL